MTVRFYIRAKKTNSTVYVSASFPGNVKYRKKTGFVVDYRKWNAKKQMPDTSTVANKNLGYELVKLRNRITEGFNKLTSEENSPTPQWFDSLLTGNEEGNTVLWAVKSLIENSHRIKGQKGGQGLSKGRVRIYEVFERKIQEYDPTWKISNVNLETVEKFKDWLYAKDYSDNYVSSFVSRLKAVCNYSGSNLSNEFGKIKTFEKPKENILTLSFKDLSEIEKLKLQGELDIARKWVLLGCELGQRGGDLLEMESFIEFEGVRIIELIQEKTGKKLAIPVNDKAYRIIKNGFPEKMKLYRFNKLIKRVCYRAGIKDFGKISSHVMRRSFATNYYGRVPTPILMRITGHSKESTFLAYVGKTSLDNAKEAMQWFRRLDNV